MLGPPVGWNMFCFRLGRRSVMITLNSAEIDFSNPCEAARFRNSRSALLQVLCFILRCDFRRAVFLFASYGGDFCLFYRCGLL